MKPLPSFKTLYAKLNKLDDHVFKKYKKYKSPPFSYKRAHALNTRVNTKLSCCGLLEISGIEKRKVPINHNNQTVRETPTPEEYLYSVYKTLKINNKLGNNSTALQGAFIIFTIRPSMTTRTPNIYSEIEKRRFGKVVKTDIAVNPNSNNRLRAYLWQPNKDFLKWGKDRYAKHTKYGVS